MTGPEIFRAAPFHAVRAGEGKHAVTRAGTDQAHIVPDLHFRVVDGMRAFLSLGEHERAAVQRLGAGAQAVRSAIDDLRRTRMLVSGAEFLRSAPQREPATIRVVGVPTLGRSTLERCVASYAAHARERGRAVRFLLAGEVTPERVDVLARECGMQVRAVGARQRLRTIERLAAAGVDMAVARFALLGEAEGIPAGSGRNTGANRNVLLLASAGEPLLTVDDDTLATLLAPPAGCAPARGFYGKDGQLEPWFDTGSPFPAEPAEGADLLGMAGAALGPALRPDAALAGCDIPHGAFERLLGGNAWVRAAQPGLYGDSGGVTPTGWLTAGGAARERLVATEAGYQRAVRSRRLFAVSPAMAVMDGEALMTYCLALDNRAALPPFPPLGCDEDGVFAVWLRACDPFSFTAQLPVAVMHEPETARAFGPGALTENATGVVLNDSLRLVVGKLPVYSPPVAAEERMVWFGARLEEIGRQPEPVYERLLRERRLTALAAMVTGFERVLASHGSRPAWWARDMQALVRAGERTMASPGLLDVREPGTAPLADPVRTCQSYLIWCGRLLQAWPEMLRAARALRDDD